jgi:hypothetical protein
MERFGALLGCPADDPAVARMADEFALVSSNSDGQLESRELGVALSVSKKGEVDAVFLFGNAKDDFLEYRGELPGGLTFQCRREEVRRAHGLPTTFADATTSSDGIVRHGGWDRYDLQDHVLHFSYARHTGFIELVTLMLGREAGGLTRR